jgi:uncharacterized protein
MSTPSEPDQGALLPVGGVERIDAIDITRGIALFGVLMMNLLIVFRVPLLEASVKFHTHPGGLNHFVDWFFELLVAGKAFTTFSLLFGVGLAMQAERAERRGRRALAFLARRLLVLLGLGLFHMLAIWNGDILTLYAVAGLLALPFVRRSPRTTLIAALIIAALLSLPIGHARPPRPDDEMAQSIADARRIYGHGSFAEIAVFRVREVVHLMSRIYLGLVPRTLAVFLIGIFAFRRGIFQRPAEHRTLLQVTAAAGLAVGGASSVVQALDGASVISLGRFMRPIGSLTMVPFTLGYVACLLLLLERLTLRRWLAWFAPAGRMALTNYLTQSVVLGFVFYSYGLGLFGQLGSAAAAPIGFALYAAQIALSAFWLRRYRFGPAEWLWRSLTYGARQPMRLSGTMDSTTAGEGS